MYEMILRVMALTVMVVFLCIIFFSMYLSFWAITSPNGKDYARENNRFYKDQKEMNLAYKHDMKILQDVHKEKLQEIYSVARTQREIKNRQNAVARKLALKTLLDLKKLRKQKKLVYNHEVNPEIKESIQNKGE